MLVGAKVCDLTEDLLWFVCGLYVGILTSPLIGSKNDCKKANENGSKLQQPNELLDKPLAKNLDTASLRPIPTWRIMIRSIVSLIDRPLV